MQFMLNIRNLGYEEFAFRGESEYDYLHVDDNFLRLAQVIELVPAEYPYLQFGQVWFTIIRPIPRVLWPGKPVDPGFDLPTALGMKGVSLSMSIIGEWYLSFGWIARHFRRLAARPAGALRQRAQGQRGIPVQPDRLRAGRHGARRRHAIDAGAGADELRPDRVVGRESPDA